MIVFGPGSVIAISTPNSAVPEWLQQTDTFEYYVTEHFRLSGVYWGLAGMAALGRLGDMDEESIVSWVQTCQVSVISSHSLVENTSEGQGRGTREICNVIAAEAPSGDCHEVDSTRCAW